MATAKFQREAGGFEIEVSHNVLAPMPVSLTFRHFQPLPAGHWVTESMSGIFSVGLTIAEATTLLQQLQAELETLGHKAAAIEQRNGS